MGLTLRKSNPVVLPSLFGRFSNQSVVSFRYGFVTSGRREVDLTEPNKWRRPFQLERSTLDWAAT